MVRGENSLRGSWRTWRKSTASRREPPRRHPRCSLLRARSDSRLLGLRRNSRGGSRDSPTRGRSADFPPRVSGDTRRGRRIASVCGDVPRSHGLGAVAIALAFQPNSVGLHRSDFRRTHGGRFSPFRPHATSPGVQIRPDGSRALHAALRPVDLGFSLAGAQLSLQLLSATGVGSCSGRSCGRYPSLP